jgi:hypothetical protein
MDKMYGVFYKHPDGGYRYIRSVFVDNNFKNHLEVVFDAMQGEVWSPNGEARPFIQNLGVQHTSMMTGDLVVDYHTGEGWLCEFSGWSAFKGCKQWAIDDEGHKSDP